MQRLLTLVPLAILCACSSTRSSVQDASNAKAQYALMASLAGEWTGEADHGSEKFPIHTEFHVTGNGTTVAETMFKGTEHEMISMYHLDGGRLMHTHYCAAGNQPRMVAQPSSSKNTIFYAFHDATNLPSPDVMHMHEMKILVKDADNIEEWWTGYVNGKPDHTAHFILKRKK
ncbi:MAG: hypothetical protein JNL28_16460 [Planctomycetes bacterium]|nr:hypothetical protein [Planctomycetota bacterium]